MGAKATILARCLSDRSAQEADFSQLGTSTGVLIIDEAQV